jgi:tetratricopeptide (TPR) repeat protein
MVQLHKVVLICFLVAFTSSLFAATDTLYIHSLIPIEVKYGTKSLNLTRGGYASFPIHEISNLYAGSKLLDKPKAKELLIINDTQEIIRLEITSTSSSNTLSVAEFNSYWNAVNRNNKGIWLKHMHDFSISILERSSLWSVQALVRSEKLLLVEQAYLQNNYIAAYDILTSLKDSNEWNTSLMIVRADLASYFDSVAHLELNNNRFQSALSLASKAYELIPSDDRKHRIVSITEMSKRVDYDQLIKRAIQLEEISKRKALSLYEESYTYYGADSLKRKINTLKNDVEDSVYNRAKSKDHSRTMIQYRILEYDQYLQSYPNGKYVAEANSRMLKLSKISGQLERNFITYGRIFWNDGKMGHQIRVGRFSEHNIFSLAVTLSDDVFLLRQQPYALDKKLEISDQDYRLAEVPGASYNEAHFVTRGNYMISYARLVGKPRVFQYYILGELGISDRYGYYLTYDLGSSILNGKPEAHPKYRRYTTEDALGYAVGLSILFNYKIVTMETGVRMDNFGYGYALGVGLSF